MQPRGQLWFALEKICQDFREYSGLAPKDSLQILVIVLRNMLAEQQAALDQLEAPALSPPSPPLA
jgi:hypothetical protein